MMPNDVKPYRPEGSKKQQVSSMFNKIAPYYDFLNRLLSLGIDTIWRKRAIEQLRGRNPQYVLDVATGTADVAIELAQRLQPEKIIGLDISAEMLRIGQKKITQKQLDTVIELQEGDSENLPFADNTFDAITVAFGVRNFETLRKGLAEMYRVLQPGGKLVILEFSKPTGFPFRQVFQAYFKYILPNVGKLTSKDPKAYQYLYESVQAFPDGQQFLDILAQTGYKSTQCIPLTLGICSIYHGEK